MLFSSKEKHKKIRTPTTIFSKSIVNKNELKINNEKIQNKTEENLNLKSSNISDKEIFDQVAGKENDIDERALVFIEQRYKVPFLQPLQQKHMSRNYKHRFNYRTFLSNTNSNADVRQVFSHKYPDSKRMPIRSHKDIYMGDKPKNHHDDVYLKEYNNINLRKDFNDDELPVYNYRNKKNKVSSVNSDFGHRFNDNALKNEIVKTDLNHYVGDPLHNHDRLLKEQLNTLNDHYRRAQDHENREKQLLNDIKAIKADIDAITAEHRQYLELLKTPIVKDIRTNLNKDYHQVKTESKAVNLPPQDSLKKEYKTVPSVTQFYAPPTNIIKSSSKSLTNIDSMPAEKESIQQMPKQSQHSQQLKSSVVQPAYLSNPPDIDFHDSRILSKIEEMNTLSASMDKDKRSSSTVTLSRLAGEGNRTTRTSEIENPCVNSNCPKYWTPSSQVTKACDCKHVSSSTYYSVLPYKTDSESTAFSKASTDIDLDVLELS